MGNTSQQPAARVGDLCSEHDRRPPTPVMQGSPDVFVNGRPLARLGDAVVPHGCKPDAEPRYIAEGAGSVLINGLPAARVTDAIDCGGTVSIGSDNVLIGDMPQSRSPTFDPE